MMTDIIPWALWGLMVGAFCYLWHRQYVRKPKEAVARSAKEAVARSAKEVVVDEREKKEVKLSTFKGSEWRWGATRKSRDGEDMPARDVLDQVLLQEIRDLMSHPLDSATLKDLVRENTEELRKLNAFLRQVYGDHE